MKNSIEINGGIVGVDLDRVRRLIGVRELNNEVAWLLCDFLNDSPKVVSANLLREVGCDGLAEQTTVAALVAGFADWMWSRNARTL